MKNIGLLNENAKSKADVTGYNLKASLLEKLDNNARAALLLMFFIEFNQENSIPLAEKIPSKEIELATGMKKKSQIYARDSLMGMNFLKRIGIKDFTYVLNSRTLAEKGFIVIVDV